MTLKKWKVISVVGIFLFSALLHFIYDWFPNFFTSLFFPVNESIGEHNKIIVGSFLFWAIIEKIYYKSKKEIKELMNEETNLFKTDYSVVMKYLFDKNYL